MNKQETSVNEGARLLAAAGTLAAVAARVDVSKASVSYWRSGSKLPDKPNRDKMRKAFAIPVDAWDRRPAGAKTKPGEGQRAVRRAVVRAAPPPPPDAGPESKPVAPGSLEHLEESLAALRKERQHGDASQGAIIKIASTEARLLDLRAKLRGEFDLNEAKILRTPQWRRIEEALLGALKAWPEAMLSAGEALKALDG